MRRKVGSTLPPSLDCEQHWRLQQTVNLPARGSTGFDSLAIHHIISARRHTIVTAPTAADPALPATARNR